MNALVMAPLEGEILRPGDMMDVVVSLNPFHLGSETIKVPVGSTLAECVEIAKASHLGARPAYIVVTIGDQRVKPEWWPRIRVKRGAFVAIQGVPGKEDGGIFRSILGLVLAIAAAVAVPFLFPAVSPLIASLIGTGIAVGGQLALNALFPVRQGQIEKAGDKSKAASKQQLFSIHGGSNEADPYGPVPIIFGRVRVFPRLAARPYTEQDGPDQYIRMLLCWGYGEISIPAEVKLGETPIEVPSLNVQRQDYIYYYPALGPISLFPAAVFEDQFQILLQSPNPWSERRTAPNVNEIIVDISAPNGIYKYQTETGQRKDWTVEVTVMVKDAAGGPYTVKGVWNRTFKSVKPRRNSFRIQMPYAAQWDVAVHKTSADFDNSGGGDNEVVEDIYWTVLRGIRHGNPIVFDKPVGVTALRIKASEAVSGNVEVINAMVAPKFWCWNGSSLVHTFSDLAPDAFLYALAGPGNPNPVPLSGDYIDFVAFNEWWHYCWARGFTFKMYRDFTSSVWDVLSDICAAGRAVPCLKDGKWSVAFDNPNDPVVGHFTPRNSREFTGQRNYLRPPHALRVSFINERNGWRQDERIVYDDGYNASNATQFESVEFPGVTHPDLVWKHGRYHIAQARLRPETYTLVVAREFMRCTFGDRVRVQHYLPLIGLQSGRVVSVDGNAIVLDEPVVIAPGKTYRIRFSPPGGTSFTRDLVNTIGETFEIEVTGTGSLPSPGDLFSFGEAALGDSAIFRVKKIEMLDEAEARLTLVDDAPEIALADQGVIPQFNSHITVPADPVDLSPQQLAAREIESAPGDIDTFRVSLTWEAPNFGSSRLTGWEVTMREFGEDGWDPVLQLGANERSATLTVPNGGRYDFRVRSRLAAGFSAWATITGFTVIGLFAVPDDVPSIDLIVNDNTTRLSWGAARRATHYMVRHSPETDGALWSTATEVVSMIPGTMTVVPSMIGTFLIKAYNEVSGYESVNAIDIVTTVAGLRGINVVELVEEHPAWEGTKSHVEVTDDDELTLSAVGGVLDWPEILSITPEYWTSQFPWADGGALSPGYIDLGEVFTSRVTVRLAARGENIANYVGAWGPIGALGYIAGLNNDQFRVRYDERHTNDDPSGSPAPVWTEWAEARTGDYTFRAIERRLVLLSLAKNVRPIVSEASMIIDMPDQMRAGSDIEITSDGMRVEFDPPFRIYGGLGITESNQAVRILTSNADETGFDVTARDGSNAFVSGQTFSYNAKGAGARVSA